MSRYFAAAEVCGLRTSGDETLRLTRRTVASTTPESLAAEITDKVKAEAEKVARFKRQPETDLAVIPVEQLPLADGRVEHSTKLQQSREELLERENRDLDDFTQRRKIQAIQEAELRQLLAEEEANKRKAEEDARALAEQRERDREQLKEELTEAYGPCFLWDRDEKEKTSKTFNGSGLEKQLVAKIAEYHSFHGLSEA